MDKTIYKIVVEEGPAMGASFVIDRQELVIGRGDDIEICILDTAISKTHCRVEKIGRECALVDLNSRNGTLLDGVRLHPGRPYRLHPGCEIRMGNTMLRFLEESRPSSADRRRVVSTMEMAIPDKAGLAGATPDGESGAAALRMLNDVLLNLGRASSEEDLFESFLSALVDALPARRACIVLPENLEGDDVRPAAMVFKDAEEAASDPSVPRDVIEKATAAGGMLPGFGALLTGGEGDRGHALCCPMPGRESALGAIYAEAARPGETFGEKEARAAASLGLVLGHALETVRTRSGLIDLQLGVLKTLVSILEARDPYSVGHAATVTRISDAIAAHLGLERPVRQDLALCAMLHDIGKTAVPAGILTKPGPLTEEEFSVVKKHPVAGASFLSHIPGLKEVNAGILSHHERFEGGGYPLGLAGKEIPLFARIIALADTFDAMTSDRAFRKALKATDVVNEILAGANTQFDEEVVEAFISALKAGELLHRKEPSLDPVGIEP
jgi:HD-GYP domain-containing protein (c-di-GMP phosphodiesterase class II)